jgi:AcrR family transcriptional regulator
MMSISTDRRARERAETRVRILDAAREMFVESGIEAVTMRAIAKRIEYTPTAIYHHFRDKHELLTELCNRDFLSLANAFMKIGRIEDPVERLRAIGRAYIAFGIENPAQYRFMFMTTAKNDVVPDVHRANPEEDAYAFLRDTVAEIIASGRFKAEHQDAERLAQMFWSAAHGIVSLSIVFEGNDHITWRDPKRTGNEISDAMIAGLLR